MIPWLKGLLYDERSFNNFVRAGVAAAGLVLQQTGVGGKAGWWVANGLYFLALLVKAGDVNPPNKT